MHYSVLSFLVGERTREIGIRLALGARRQTILWMVLGEGARLAIAGTVFLLLRVALLACYVPARRALRVNSTVALRLE
jgi:ABC-type antimicrobial peptide transport system permease subunit